MLLLYGRVQVEAVLFPVLAGKRPSEFWRVRTTAVTSALNSHAIGCPRAAACVEAGCDEPD